MWIGIRVDELKWLKLKFGIRYFVELLDFEKEDIFVWWK